MWAEDGMAMRVSARWCSGGQGADSLITQVFYEKEGGPHFMRFLRAEVRRKKRERKRQGRGRHLGPKGFRLLAQPHERDLLFYGSPHLALPGAWARTLQGPERSSCSASTLLLKRLYFKVLVRSPA